MLETKVAMLMVIAIAISSFNLGIMIGRWIEKKFGGDD